MARWRVMACKLAKKESQRSLANWRKRHENGKQLKSGGGVASSAATGVKCAQKHLKMANLKIMK